MSPIIGGVLNYGLTLADIRLRVQRIFGDTTEVEIQIADIDKWANDAQLDIARRTDCLQAIHTIGTQVGIKSYPFAEQYISIRRVAVDGIKLARTTLEELDNTHDDRDSAYPNDTPSQYYVFANQLFLYPAPAVAGSNNIEIFYIRAPIMLVAPEQIPEIPFAYHEDIVRYCVARAKELDEEFEDANRFMEDYETRVSDARATNQWPHIDSYPAVRLLPGDD